MKLKPCIVLLALSSLPVLAQSAPTVVNCPVQILSTSLKSKATGDYYYVQGLPDANGIPTFSPPRLDTMHVLSVKLKNISQREILSVGLVDETGNRFSYVYSNFLPGKDKSNWGVPVGTGEPTESGMAVWVTEVIYSDGKIWENPNSGSNSSDETSSSCYYKKVVTRAAK